MIVLGLIEDEAERFFNLAIVPRTGRLVGRCRKKHLHAAGRQDTPETDGPVFEVDGPRLGIGIRHDTNFPDTARDMANAGASPIMCGAKT